MRQALFIGSELGGLAAAARRKARGYDVTVVERQHQPGGRARVFEDKDLAGAGVPGVLSSTHVLDSVVPHA